MFDVKHPVEGLCPFAAVLQYEIHTRPWVSVLVIMYLVLPVAVGKLKISSVYMSSE